MMISGIITRCSVLALVTLFNMIPKFLAVRTLLTDDDVDVMLKMTYEMADHCRFPLAWAHLTILYPQNVH